MSDFDKYLVARRRAEAETRASALDALPTSTMPSVLQSTRGSGVLEPAEVLQTELYHKKLFLALLLLDAFTAVFLYLLQRYATLVSDDEVVQTFVIPAAQRMAYCLLLVSYASFAVSIVEAGITMRQMIASRMSSAVFIVDFPLVLCWAYALLLRSDQHGS